MKIRLYGGPMDGELVHISMGAYNNREPKKVYHQPKDPTGAFTHEEIEYRPVCYELQGVRIWRYVWEEEDGLIDEIHGTEELLTKRGPTYLFGTKPPEGVRVCTFS